MFPKISDLVNHLTGMHFNLPFQTYGFMLALAFLSAGMVLRGELKRKENGGQLPPVIRHHPTSGFRHWLMILLQAVFVAVVAWKSVAIMTGFSKFSANPQRFIFSGEGSFPLVLIVVALYLGVAFFRHRATRSESARISETMAHPFQYTWNILIIAIVSAIAGSKLFDIADNFSTFLRNPVDSLLSMSGFAFLGGLIATVIVLVVYVRMIKLDWRQVIDATAPAIMIGYAIGRLGCHLSGDGCWGVINTCPPPGWLAWLPDWAWACRYPHNVINAGIPIPGCVGPHCRVLTEPVYPTSLYESMLSTLFFGILWFLRTRIQAPVVLFSLFLVLHGTGRLLIEQIRINTRHDLFGLHLSQAEIISAILTLTGLAAVIVFKRLHHQGASSG
jgi:prolipoprotein diacylglyceryl transferase